MVRDIVPEGVTRIVLNANVKNIDWSDHVTVLTHDRRKWDGRACGLHCLENFASMHWVTVVCGEGGVLSPIQLALS